MTLQEAAQALGTSEKAVIETAFFEVHGEVKPYLIDMYLGIYKKGEKAGFIENYIHYIAKSPSTRT